MSEHVSRGVFAEEDVDVPGDALDDGYVMGDYHCRDCDTLVRLRCREGEHAYVRLGCDCGAVSVGLRIAQQIDGDLERGGVEKWERRRGFDEEAER